MAAPHLPLGRTIPDGICWGPSNAVNEDCWTCQISARGSGHTRILPKTSSYIPSGQAHSQVALLQQPHRPHVFVEAGREGLESAAASRRVRTAKNHGAAKDVLLEKRQLKQTPCHEQAVADKQAANRG
jgi:hypothetical protein